MTKPRNIGKRRGFIPAADCHLFASPFCGMIILMRRLSTTHGIAVLAVLAVACGQTPGVNLCGNGIWDPGETPETCPEDAISPCNNDGYCDPGESVMMCPSDGCGLCDPPSFLGDQHAVLVETLSVPTTPAQAAVEGVDLDGDGDIDNALGRLGGLLDDLGLEWDLDGSVNQDIATGRLLLLGRIIASGRPDDVVGVQFLRGALLDATPIFDGHDTVGLSPESPSNLWLCGSWIEKELATSPSDTTFSVSLPELGTLELTLSNFMVRTVDDPESDYFGRSAVDGTLWTDVMVGGGLSRYEIEQELIPFWAQYFSNLAPGPDLTPQPIIDFLDGNCEPMPDVEGCATVVPGEGECDDTSVPPVITETELRCNYALRQVLAPDVDSDGDGVPDLLSFGFRIVRAVGVTVVE